MNDERATAMSISGQVNAILAAYYDVTADELLPDKKLLELGDSLDAVQVLLAVEDQLDIDLSAVNRRALTVGSLLDAAEAAAIERRALGGWLMAE